MIQLCEIVINLLCFYTIYVNYQENCSYDQFSACKEATLANIDAYIQSHTFAYYSQFYGPSSAGNYYKVWASFVPVNQMAPSVYPAYLYSGYFNKTIDQTYSDKQFPIGKGWSWNINSIEWNNCKKDLQLAGKELTLLTAAINWLDINGRI